MTARRACKGPSCCFRHKVQRLNFIKGSVTVRRAHDGPSCHVVAKFRELFSVPKFLESKCFGMRPPRRSVVGSVDPESYYHNKLYCSKMTKQVVTIDTNLPIVRPRMITRRKTRARKSTWICEKVWISFLLISLLLPSGLFNWLILPLNFYGCNLLWSQLADFSI